MDLAGRSYWDKHWEGNAGKAFSADSSEIRDYRDVAVAGILKKSLQGLSNAVVLEAGCADSVLLPYLARQGHRVIGVDYSDAGCERARGLMESEGLEAQIACCDIFDIPAPLKACADVVVSYGLVEHFTETAACIRALAEFVKPGGRILTIIPNMRGLVGAAQFLCAPSVYRVHVPLKLDTLSTAHREAGLTVTSGDYLLPAGFGVVNYTEPGASKPAYFLRRAGVGMLSRLSFLTWAIDRRVALPRGPWLSPYLYCIAEKR